MPATNGAVQAHPETPESGPFEEDIASGHTIEPQETRADRDESESSEDDCSDTEGNGSLLAVTIGREQLRLILPQTPAAEKSAALDEQNSWGFFDGVDEDGQQEVLRETLETTAVSSSGPARPPPPDTPLRRSEGPQRSSWFAGLRGGNRSRATSSPYEGSITAARNSVSSFFGDAQLKKFLPSLNFSFPTESMIARHRPSLSLGTGVESIDFAPRRGRSRTWLQNNTYGKVDSPTLTTSPGSSQVLKINTPRKTAVTPPADAQNQLTAARQVPLRRSTSLDSFRPPLSRRSTLSLLENEPNWDHVTQQVNSRRKAIKDALQDSLPQMPNLNLGNLRPDIAFKNFWDSERPPIQPRSNSDTIITNNPKTIASKDAGPAPSVNPRSKCPSLDAAAQRLTGDIVILGGYRGSILREMDLPQRQLWVPVKVGLNIRRVNLEVGLNPEDEEDMHNHIFASGMLANIGPVDMGRRLFKRLRDCENAQKGTLRVWDYGYDWRLSPHLLSRRLINFLEGLQCNKRRTKSESRGATVIAHSLGGLITRHAVNQRPDLFAGVVYAGTPQHAVNILGPLRNGDDVLLSSKVLTAQVNFSFRTSFLLLPENGHCFIDRDSKKVYLVDFFEAENWQKYAFSPCVANVLPPWNPVERKSLFGSLYDSLPSLLSSNASTPTKMMDTAVDGPTLRKIKDVTHPDEGTVGMQVQPTTLSAKFSALPFEEAMAYLRRTLADIKQFKTELQHNSELEASNRYPPHALIYSTSVPTVYGARVASREAIKHADAFDELAFASGDGVVLARAAMMPRGYQTVPDGRVLTERGHVSLLADLEAVGKCLLGLHKGRAAGIGLGATSLGQSDTE